jgi:hypothetical protein
MIPAKDISKYQGAWQDTGEPIVMIKMSGGDDGLYMDSNAATNYSGAAAAGRAVGGYHFAGNTNAVAEATYFMQAMSPLAENDVYALDWELPVGTAGAVEWCQTFMQTIHDKIGVWPLIYMNLNTLNSYDWSPVLANCGLWLADWNNDPSGTINTVHSYVMQQYSDGPNYDHDEWFGTIEEFKAYGYHATNDPNNQAAPAPPPPPVEAPPVVVPEPATEAPNPIAPPPVTSTTTPSITTPRKPLIPTITITTVKRHWYDFVINFIKAVLKGI